MESLIFLIFIVLAAGFGALGALVVIIGEQSDEVIKSLSEISESLGVLADHIEYYCDKCKAEAESKDTTNPS